MPTTGFLQLCPATQAGLQTCSSPTHPCHRPQAKTACDMLAVRLGYSIADSTGSSTQFTETPETHTYTNTGQEPTVLLQLRLPAAPPYVRRSA